MISKIPIRDFVIIGLMAFIIFMQFCNKPKAPEVKVIRLDSFTNTKQEPQPAQQVQPYQVQPIIIQPAGQNIPIQYTQITNDLQTLKNQISELAGKLYASNIYKDSIVLRDTAGRRVGVVNLSDVVSENQIKTRAPSYQLSFPHTVSTITKTLTAPQTRQFYLGAGINGNKFGLSSIEGGVLYKDRHDRIFNAKAGLGFDGKIVYGIGTYWKVKLKK